MEIDISTLILVSGLTHIIQFIVFVHQYRVNKAFRGVEWWLLWSVAEVIGFTFMLLRQMPSISLLAIIGQNSLIIAGVMFLYIGILRFFDKRESRILLASIFAAFLASFNYFLFLQVNYEARSIVISATLATFSFLSAQALLVHKTRSVAATASFLAVVLLAHGCFHVVRAELILAGIPAGMVFASTLLNIGTYLDAIVAGNILTFGFIIMINQRLHSRLREAKEEIEKIFITSPDAVVISRMSDGLITNVNEGFSVITGFSRDEAIGKSIVGLKIWNNPDDRQAILDELRARGFCNNIEAIFRRKDGRESFGLLSANIIELQYDQYMISITRDITERKRGEKVLQQAKANLEKANRQLQEAFEQESKLTAQAQAGSAAKSQFVATISHEIRTPLNGIIGIGELLQATNLSAEQKKYVQIINASAEILLNIVNSTLDFSKIEAGKIELEHVDFHLGTRMDEIMRVLAMNAVRKKLEVIHSIAPDVPLNLNGDPGRLRQILVNLTGNAIKFTTAGKITVRVTLIEEKQGKAFINFAVRDTGIGIPADKMDQLFKAFTQLDASMARKFGGTGLGLAISKGLVEQMGGTIGVESVPGKGSTFWFTVPFLRQQGAVQPPKQSELAAVAGETSKIESRRILVAEDNKVNQIVIAGILKKMGHAVDIVADGREAVSALEKADYDLVLMDIQMPGMDGYEATNLIRSPKTPVRNPSIPILALTAHTLPEELNKCMVVGMNGCLAKPVNMQSVADAIAKIALPCPSRS